ncbi:hypothetical protein HYALB_00008795 [Hymenoscyphus albidus]|uniref:Ketoreductase domain-containing protein n=1 Tax=Hymenoscyphus albidus TaxID=595503 RepID=A0A9N9LY95_9HELO|nr:hypothetical protein HYALB_00008795 [Hymenoscyphus albidus]
MADRDMLIKQTQFTKTYYRDVYPAIEPTSPSNSQAGKVVVVTGAGKGIGRESFVKSFAKAGAKALVIVARSSGPLEEVRQEILSISKDIIVQAVVADVRDANSVTALWETVKEKFGRADVLINNAGTLNAGTVAEEDVDEWWLDFETNIRGTFLISQGFLKLLGKESKGTILNLSSALGLATVPGLSAYSLTKLVAHKMQAFIAVENPNVVAIGMHPGLIRTDIVTGDLMPFAFDTFDLAGGTAVWLATEKAAFLNGKYVNVNWSVEELVQRKEEIVGQKKLDLVLSGEFGEQQFL